jgi:hypothetical protein
MHETIDINFGTAIIFSILLIFGICAMLVGLFMAGFGSGKSRAMGFLEMTFGWTSLFVLYMFFWNRTFFYNMLGAIIGAIVGIIMALGLLFLLVLKS